MEWAICIYIYFFRADFRGETVRQMVSLKMHHHPCICVSECNTPSKENRADVLQLLQIENNGLAVWQEPFVE